ncbi:MAG: DUF1501 domain-containing protein, partial [Planctomycetota bacterium]
MFDLLWDGNRRNFLRVGGLSSLGFGLSSWLRLQTEASTLQAAEAPSGEASAASAARTSRRAKSVILVYLGGGLSHHDSFDLKPDAIAEVRGKYQPIATNIPGLQVGELLPLMAQTMDKVCL